MSGLWVFGKVPTSRDCPRTLGLSQRPRVPTCSRILFSTSRASESQDREVFGKVPRSWDSPGMFRLSQRPRVPIWIMFSSSKASEAQDLEVFGKVPRSWESPGTLGLSQRSRVLKNSRMIFYLSKVSKNLADSQGPGTCPSILNFGPAVKTCILCKSFKHSITIESAYLSVFLQWVIIAKYTR